MPSGSDAYCDDFEQFIDAASINVYLLSKYKQAGVDGTYRGAFGQVALGTRIRFLALGKELQNVRRERNSLRFFRACDYRNNSCCYAT